jgi:hypothetical protein
MHKTKTYCETFSCVKLFLTHFGIVGDLEKQFPQIKFKDNLAQKLIQASFDFG